MKAVVPFLPRNIKLHSPCSGSEHVNPNFCCTYIPPDNLGSPNERTCCDHWDNEIPINLCINTPLDNQDRANRLDSDNMECTSDFQSDTSKYDNIDTMWTYIPSDSSNISQGAPNGYDLPSHPNKTTHIYNDNRNIKINKNPPQLDKKAWDKIDIEFIKVNQNS